MDVGWKDASGGECEWWGAADEPFCQPATILLGGQVPNNPRGWETLTEVNFNSYGTLGSFAHSRLS